MEHWAWGKDIALWPYWAFLLSTLANDKSSAKHGLEQMDLRRVSYTVGASERLRQLSLGVGDSQKCYELAEKHHKELITPPKQGAILRKERCYQKKNKAVQAIRGLGGDKLARSIWGKLVGYNRRVEIESLIARWKGMDGGELRSRSKERMTKEVKIKALMLNTMIEQERVA